MNCRVDSLHNSNALGLLIHIVRCVATKFRVLLFYLVNDRRDFFPGDCVALEFLIDYGT